MSIIDLKEQIHHKIDQLNNEEILTAINNLISADKKTLFVIPEEWKPGIQQGQEDIAAGRIYTLQDFEKKYQHWLGK